VEKVAKGLKNKSSTGTDEICGETMHKAAKETFSQHL
jgi:hypothetical protein